MSKFKKLIIPITILASISFLQNLEAAWPLGFFSIKNKHSEVINLTLCESSRGLINQKFPGPIVRPANRIIEILPNETKHIDLGEFGQNRMLEKYIYFEHRVTSIKLKTKINEQSIIQTIQGPFKANKRYAIAKHKTKNKVKFYNRKKK